MPFLFFSQYDILILIGAVIAIIAQVNVKSTFSRYSKVLSSSNLSGAQAARLILDKNGLSDIPVENVSGSLTDHYDPKSRVIRLSDDVFNTTSVAAIGVAAHEAGHALQHQTNYSPIKLRNAIIPITNIGSNMALPLILIGFFMGFGGLVTLGIFAYSLAVVFQLITLPVEFNASNRAVASIASMNILSENEAIGTKKVLNAAALTYVAALAASLLSLLRLILIFGGRRD